MRDLGWIAGMPSKEEPYDRFSALRKGQALNLIPFTIS